MLTKEDEIIQEQDKRIKALKSELNVAKHELQELEQKHAQLQYEYDIKKMEIEKRNCLSSVK